MLCCTQVCPVSCIYCEWWWWWWACLGAWGCKLCRLQSVYVPRLHFNSKSMMPRCDASAGVTLPQLTLLEAALAVMPRVEVFIMQRSGNRPTGSVFEVSLPAGESLGA
jgi:hypothetical protein